MENNVYEAPQADLATQKEEEDASLNQEFYVVGITKFFVLFIATLGIYSIYWFYRNWKLYRRRNNEDIWPVARGIFSIFFAHSLFNNVEAVIDNKKLEYSWSPNTIATFYVLLTIVNRIFDRLMEQERWFPYTEMVSFLLIPIIGFILSRAQKAINISQDDPLGATNAKFTLANYLWCIPGIVFWVVITVSIVVLLAVPN
ncbi:hypothetical protein TDB9533_02426 [Thalassocella blandensis]|nr:hypothetical protein TDB9533_02426 [Thalassocella blandensis]